MNTIECIEVFSEVAKSLSFSKAANRLGVSKSSVSKRIAWLESEFEVQLLSRNTKRVNLTESGRILLEKAEDLTFTIKNLKDLVRSPVQVPSGIIRIGAPPSFGAVHLVPALNDFLVDYSKIKISLLLDDGRSDLISENIDLSVRIASRLKDTNQVAYKIAAVPQVIVATQEYLASHGVPLKPQDLEKHNCLVHSLKSPTGIWTFTDNDNASYVVHVAGSFNSNLGESILHLAKLGHGISMHPRYMVDTDLRKNDLQILLPGFKPEGLDIYAIIQSRRYLPYKVRLLVDHLRAWFKNRDWS